jgi:hypothetical protein
MESTPLLRIWPHLLETGKLGSLRLPAQGIPATRGRAIQESGKVMVMEAHQAVVKRTGGRGGGAGAFSKLKRGNGSAKKADSLNASKSKTKIHVTA